MPYLSNQHKWQPMKWGVNCLGHLTCRFCSKSASTNWKKDKLKNDGSIQSDFVVTFYPRPTKCAFNFVSNSTVDTIRITRNCEYLLAWWSSLVWTVVLCGADAMPVSGRLARSNPTLARVMFFVLFLFPCRFSFHSWVPLLASFSHSHPSSFLCILLLSFLFLSCQFFSFGTRPTDQTARQRRTSLLNPDSLRFFSFYIHAQ